MTNSFKLGIVIEYLTLFKSSVYGDYSIFRL
nr:MAG TPA: hypothetical protein [Caudoviricetes sp.]